MPEATARKKTRAPSVAKYNRKIQRLLKRDGHNCWLCGKPFVLGSSPKGRFAPTLDHVIERRNGGWNSSDNLRLAHRDCNSARAHRFPHTNNDGIAATDARVMALSSRSARAAYA